MKIELREVAKRFGRVPALAGISATVEAGQRVALIGPNGSGKSTLIRILMGLLRAKGDVRIDGRSPFYHRLELARRMACVPQIAPRLNATVDELVRITAGVRGIAPEDVFRLAGQLNLAIEPIRRRPFRHLSGGMKQKLLIALAFAAKADLLIMDEPTASLDAAARDRFFRLFEAEAGGATLILCSHRLEEIRHLVDHVIALDDGAITYDGPARELLAGRTVSVIEICLKNGEFGDWLRDRGFHQGRDGWWMRTVSQDEKLGLLPTIAHTISSSRMHNMLVRDLDTLDVAERS